MPNDASNFLFAAPVTPERPPALRVAVAGPMAALTRTGVKVLPKGRKTRALLAILALASPGPVRRERITALLWSRRDADHARASLRQCVHELHEALESAGPFLVAERAHLALRGDGLAIEGPERTGLHPSRLLEDLFGLDPAFDKFIAAERQRALSAAVQRAEAVLEAQPGADARLAAATALLVLDPAHEGAWRASMRAHADRGDTEAMEEAFSRCIDALAGTRGMAPSAETRTLLAALRGGGAPAQRASPIPNPLARARSPRAGGRGARVGVMPPRALSTPGDAGLAAGLADEITTALARFRWLFLIASPSIAAVAQPGAEAARRWRELDLDFLLDGTLQRGPSIAGKPGVVRVSLRLLDMRGATVDAAGPAAPVVWSGRFDRAADDLLTLQDEIASEAAAQIDPQLIQHESRRAGQRPASSATAYDLVLRAIPALQRLQELEFREAGDALARAATLDPGYAAAHAWWAYWHIFLVGQGWTADRASAMARAGELAERAVSLDPGDARALTIAGHVRAFLHRRLDEALGLHERALALNPNLPLAWAFSGLALSYDGNHAEAVRRIGEARRLSPFDPLAFFFDTSLMVPHLMLGAFGRVVELGRRAAVLNPTLSSTFKLLLSALGHMGAHDEAHQVRRKLLALEPDYTLAEATIRSTFRRPEDLALFRDGLAKGGLAYRRLP